MENRRKHFLPSSTAAVRNDSARPEKTGTLFLFSFEPSSVLWVFAGLHEVSMNAAFPPMRLQLGSQSPEFLHFLILSSSHYPSSGWTRSKVRAVRRWPTFSFCQGPSFSYPLAALSPVSLVVLKLQGFEGNYCVLTALSNAKKKESLAIEIKIQDFSFYFNVFNHPVFFLLS